MTQYQFILLSNNTGERLELTNAPEGWSETKINLIRDLTYFGILKSISVEFAFVGEAFTFLQLERLRFGQDFDVIVRCYRESGEWFFDGKVNNENYDEDRKFKKFICDIIQSTFVQKFHNSEDIKLNVRNTLNLDREDITPAIFQPAIFRGKTILYRSIAKLSDNDTVYQYHHSIPFIFSVNGNPSVSQPLGFQAIANEVEADNLAPNLPEEIVGSSESQIYRNVFSTPQDVEIDFDIAFTATGLAETLGFYPQRRIRVVVLDAINAIVETLFEVNVENEACYGDFAYDETISATIQPGHRVLFLNEQTYRTNVTIPTGTLQASDLMLIFNAEYTYTKLDMTITNNSVIENLTRGVILPHELFANLIAQINGGKFYSEFFGRPDLGYDYLGDGALVGITTGEVLRGIDEDSVQVICSMRDAFRSYSSIFCLGAIIRDDNTIQIEPLEDLINHEIAYDMGEVKNLHVKPAKDYLFNSVKAGYPINEYEQENGRDEFNTTYQFTNSFRSTKKELDLVSIFNGDGYGITFALRAGVQTTGTADSRYDKLIFFIDLIENPDFVDHLVDPRYITRRNEEILSVSGIFSPETAMNLRIAVGQNMLRWKRFLNIPLWRKPDNLLFFQSKDKNAGLQLVTLLGTTNDGEDINLGTAYFFLPEERSFEVALPLAGLNGILANPLGIVKFRYEEEDFFDLILEGNSEDESKDSEWRCLGMKPTPVLEEEDPLLDLLALKHGDGADDYVKYDDGADDVVLYGEDEEVDDDIFSEEFDPVFG